MRRRAFFISGFLLLALAGFLAATVGSMRVAPTPPRELAMADAERFLFEAARAGELDLIVGLVRAGVPVDTQDERGFSALILAAYHGHAPVVDALLELGANACLGDRRGNTALMGAAFKGYGAIVERLAAQPCAVDQRNSLGQTALMFAKLFGRGDSARILENRGASPEVRDDSGRSAADWVESQRSAYLEDAERARRP